VNIAIIGASNDRSKFGNKAVRAYVKQGHDVFPVHLSDERIEGLVAFKSVLEIPVEIDRVSLYVRPEVTLLALDEIAEKGAKELFLNPGSESDAVLTKAGKLGLNPIVACSILDIGETPGTY
jgi:predicted CoA-binding protein